MLLALLIQAWIQRTNATPAKEYPPPTPRVVVIEIDKPLTCTTLYWAVYG